MWKDLGWWRDGGKLNSLILLRIAQPWQTSVWTTGYATVITPQSGKAGDASGIVAGEPECPGGLKHGAHSYRAPHP